MKSLVGPSPCRAASRLGLVAVLALAIAPAAQAAVKIELSGTKQGNKCTSSQPLRDYGSWTCLTEELSVIAPGGDIRYSYAVATAKGCPEVGAIVRTTGKKPGQYSFTERFAAAGTTQRGKLTASLSTIEPQPYAPKKGTVLKLSIQMPWKACTDLKSFKVTVRFPGLSKKS